jgi:gliding motility-associated-like protein
MPYDVLFDGKPIAVPPVVSSNSEIYTVTGLPAGRYPVKVKDATGCEKEVTVMVANNAIRISYEIAQNVGCNKDGTGFIVVLPKQSSASYTYKWEYYTDKWEQLDTRFCSDKLTCRSIEGLNAGDYRLTVTSGSCTFDTIFHVEAANTVEAKLDVLGGVDPTTLCPGVTFDVKGSLVSTDMSAASAVWLVTGANPESFDASIPVKSVGAVNGKVQLAAQLITKDKDGKTIYCRDTATVVVATHPVPSVVMATDTVYIPKDEIYTLITEIAGDYQPESVLWTSNPAYGYHDYGQTVSPIEISAPDADKPYTLKITVSNEIGCKVSDSIFVSRALDFFIPNAFTPNDDGNHDTWKFRNIDQYVDYYEIQVAVFNRGGFQVYSGKGYNNGSVVWNGRRNGNDLPIGTYYYVVKLVPKSSTGQTHIFTGSVTIIR